MSDHYDGVSEPLSGSEKRSMRQESVELDIERKLHAAASQTIADLASEVETLKKQRDVLLEFAETVAEGKRGDCTCWVCELARQAQKAIAEASIKEGKS